MWLSQHKCWYNITHLFINTIFNQISTHVKFEQKYVFSYEHTTKNATDLLQVVNFTSSLELVNKLQQTHHLHQAATNLLKSDTIDIIMLETREKLFNLGVFSGM